MQIPISQAHAWHLPSSLPQLHLSSTNALKKGNKSYFALSQPNLRFSSSFSTTATGSNTPFVFIPSCYTTTFVMSVLMTAGCKNTFLFHFKLGPRPAGRILRLQNQWQTNPVVWVFCWQRIRTLISLCLFYSCSNYLHLVLSALPFLYFRHTKLKISNRKNSWRHKHSSGDPPESPFTAQFSS